MGETTAAGTRCPRCSAAVRPGAPWCTQCYAPVGAVAAVADRPLTAPGGGGVAERTPAARPPAPTATATTGTWPCTACSAPNDLALATCSGCGTPFLAAAREARPTVVLPVVGDLLALTPVRRVGVAACCVVVCTLALAVLALLLA